MYRQHYDNTGMFTSTDFGLMDRIRAGEDIGIDELVTNRDPLAKAILCAGGLPAYGEENLSSARLRSINTDRPRIFTQKIVEDPDWHAEPGTGGFVRADFRFIHEYYTAMAAQESALR